MKNLHKNVLRPFTKETRAKHSIIIKNTLKKKKRIFLPLQIAPR